MAPLRRPKPSLSSRRFKGGRSLRAVVDNAVANEIDVDVPVGWQCRWKSWRKLGQSAFRFWLEFSRPAEIDPGSKKNIAIQLTEGWILGASPTVRHH
jgi:hypothetical protein